MEFLDGLMFEEMFDDWGGNYYWCGFCFLVESLGVDWIVDFCDYSVLLFIIFYGFNKVIIV